MSLEGMRFKSSPAGLENSSLKKKSLKALVLAELKLARKADKKGTLTPDEIYASLEKAGKLHCQHSDANAHSLLKDQYTHQIESVCEKLYRETRVGKTEQQAAGAHKGQRTAYSYRVQQVRPRNVGGGGPTSEKTGIQSAREPHHKAAGGSASGFQQVPGLPTAELRRSDQSAAAPKELEENYRVLVLGDDSGPDALCYICRPCGWTVSCEEGSAELLAHVLSKQHKENIGETEAATEQKLCDNKAKEHAGPSAAKSSSRPAHALLEPQAFRTGQKRPAESPAVPLAPPKIKILRKQAAPQRADPAQPRPAPTSAGATGPTAAAGQPPQPPVREAAGVSPSRGIAAAGTPPPQPSAREAAGVSPSGGSAGAARPPAAAADSRLGPHPQPAASRAERASSSLSDGGGSRAAEEQGRGPREADSQATADEDPEAAGGNSRRLSTEQHAAALSFFDKLRRGGCETKGWRIEMMQRQNGKTKGLKHKIYYLDSESAPGGQRRFRSLKEVSRYLGVDLDTGVRLPEGPQTDLPGQLPGGNGGGGGARGGPQKMPKTMWLDDPPEDFWLMDEHTSFKEKMDIECKGKRGWFCIFKNPRNPARLSCGVVCECEDCKGKDRPLRSFRITAFEKLHARHGAKNWKVSFSLVNKDGTRQPLFEALKKNGYKEHTHVQPASQPHSAKLAAVTEAATNQASIIRAAQPFVNQNKTTIPPTCDAMPAGSSAGQTGQQACSSEPRPCKDAASAAPLPPQKNVSAHRDFSAATSPRSPADVAGTPNIAVNETEETDMAEAELEHGYDNEEPDMQTIGRTAPEPGDLEERQTSSSQRGASVMSTAPERGTQVLEELLQLLEEKEEEMRRAEEAAAEARDLMKALERHQAELVAAEQHFEALKARGDELMDKKEPGWATSFRQVCRTIEAAKVEVAEKKQVWTKAQGAVSNAKEKLRLAQVAQSALAAVMKEVEKAWEEAKKL